MTVTMTLTLGLGTCSMHRKFSRTLDTQDVSLGNPLQTSENYLTGLLFMINSHVCEFFFFFFLEYCSKSAHMSGSTNYVTFFHSYPINVRHLLLQSSLVLSPAMGLSQECAEHIKHIAHPAILCLG